MSEIPPYQQPSQPGFDPHQSNYPRPQYSAMVRPPGVYFDAIGEAWKYVMAQPAVWIPSMLLAAIVYLIVAVPTSLAGNFFTYGEWLGSNFANFSVVGYIGSIAIQTVASSIMYAFIAGAMMMGLKQMRGEGIEIADVFGGFRNFPNMILGIFLYSLAVIIGLVLCLIPGLWVAGAFSMVPGLIAMRGQSAIEAIGTSMNTTAKHGFGLFALMFVMGLINLLGAIPCGLGMLVTLPMYAVVWAIHYSYFFPDSVGVPQPTQPGW